MYTPEGSAGTPSDRLPTVAAKVRIPSVRALRLERLESRLDDVWERRLGLIVAPAGSGKTTLVAGYASALDDPVAWYRAESWDARGDAWLRHLEQAFRTSLEPGGRSPSRIQPGHTGGPDKRSWNSVETAAAALEAWPGRRCLLVVDDLHVLEGTNAEAALERLIEYAPRSLAVLAATRTTPAFNLSRRRLSGELVEIGSDDLRFRSWEVERLFREVYEETVPPQELAALARLMDGWPAGLQFFHLAIRGKSADERRRLLTDGGASARLIREYLLRNVLDELPAELRTFLVETSVFRRLTGDLCDRLLGRVGSNALLEELERRQIFTTRLDDAPVYRYHEVLRGHLEATLLDRDGEELVRARYRRAGELLMAAEEVADALGAFARAGDGDLVGRLLRSRGGQLVDQPNSATWLDALPPGVVRNDPWLLLATARRALHDGLWAAALRIYGDAERGFGESAAAGAARRERLALRAWFEPPAMAHDWSTMIRRAVDRDPLGVAARADALPTPTRYLASGLCRLLAGRVVEARRDFRRVTADPSAPPMLVGIAACGAGVAAFLAGDDTGTGDLDLAARTAERLQATWLARIVQAARALRPGETTASEAAATRSLREACEAHEDLWGALLIRLIECWSGQSTSEAKVAVAAADRAVVLGTALGAGVLAAWAASISARAAVLAGVPGAADAARAAELDARTLGVPGAKYVAAAAVPMTDGAADSSGSVEALRASCGIGLPGVADERMDSPRAVPAARLTGPQLTIRCLGGFSVEIDGHAIDHTAIRPRARSVLYLLALHAGTAIHREVIQAAIWPADEHESTTGPLHVAISSIRRLIEPRAAHGAARLIARDGDGYRLDLPERAVVDHLALEAGLTAGRAARERHDTVSAIDAFSDAVALYRGDLLVEAGPAEWVLDRRDHCRAVVIQAAEALAEVHLDDRGNGDPAAAAEACLAGLAIERYHDPFWRLLIRARERAGDHGAARRVREEYREMLAQLGLPASAAGPPERRPALPPPTTSVARPARQRATINRR